jgi:hypothetical protein
MKRLKRENFVQLVVQKLLKVTNFVRGVEQISINLDNLWHLVL